MQLLKNSNKDSTKFELMIQSTGAQNLRFSLDWIISRRAGVPIAFIFQSSSPHSIQMHGSAENKSLWEVVVALQELS